MSERYKFPEYEVLDDKYIIKNFFSGDGIFRGQICNYYQNRKEGYYDDTILEYLVNRYDDSESIKETILRIRDNIKHRPICPICGKTIKPCFRDPHHLFNTTCSPSCAQRANKHNLYNCNQAELTRRRKISMMKKYGVENPFSLKEIRDHVVATNIERYGVPNLFKLKSFKDRMKIIQRSPEYHRKRYETMKARHTFNSSRIEDKTYEILLKKFPDTIHQYTSKEYPFECDFYIPSINTYIELNYHWTHGDHFYNENDRNDIGKLELWKSKNTKYYNNAIDTWTIRDIHKKIVAESNCLNYLVFFNENDFNIWFSKC